ncbi:hypothetical protein QVD17_13073 [Tagetes erecta]|uniref:Peptidase metallopeptidase domain-containing protein n=1 Tax=Tagetes erecta TaxID=13708 RepID=A0AAD8P380_TARER|nr:hypothetical protein QVD17_13073 [Tagetes erecta]
MGSTLYYSFPCIFFLFSFVLPVFSHVQRPHLHQDIDDNTYSSPFGFLKKMQGCHKGEKVKGIGDVKLYLSHFGYLNYQTVSNVTNPEEDYFDEELEVAIKSYQVYYHLNATGILDSLTVSMMVMPRCGFPDKETHQRGDIVSHYSLFPSRSKWPYGKRHLTYGFGSSFPTRFMPPIRRALRRWAIASRYFTFSKAATRESADIKISFARGAHRDVAPFDGRGGVMAHAFAPTNGRLHFDVDDRWSVGAVPYAYDIETVALHEIGHILGLGHSQYRNAIMWATIGAGESKGLTLDDIRGLRALYGS